MCKEVDMGDTEGEEENKDQLPPIPNDFPDAAQPQQQKPETKETLAAPTHNTRLTSKNGPVAQSKGLPIADIEIEDSD